MRARANTASICFTCLAVLLWSPVLWSACCDPFAERQASSQATNIKPASGNTSKSSQNVNSDDRSTRVVGVIPAFNTSNDPNAPPLEPKEKFNIFLRSSYDPFSLISPAINSAILNSAGFNSDYGDGFGGFSKRYGAALADATSGRFFRTYMYPVLLHEDPRYFRASSGAFKSRVGHVLGSVFVTRKDSMKYGFNWSKPLGAFSSSALSNTYYPSDQRGIHLTLVNAGLSYFTEIGSNALKEFWPDVSRKLLRKK